MLKEFYKSMGRFYGFCLSAPVKGLKALATHTAADYSRKATGAGFRPCPRRAWDLPAVGGLYPLYLDMLRENHILIAGTTGSGKSVVLNGLLYTLLATRTPEQARLILIDPKIIELAEYKTLPHTMAYITEAAEAVQTLQAVYDLMQERYTRMEARHERKSTETPVYIIIDELADLMTHPDNKTAKAFKMALQRLLQKARAANIHIIAATQAPNRAVIPAGVVLNFTARLALRCLSSIESRQIINQGGAEKLRGYGKGLYLSPAAGVVPVNNIPLITDGEIMTMCAYWKN